MLIDLLPTINKAFSMVIQQERHLTAGSSQVFVSNTMRQHSSSKKSQAKSSTDSRQCTFCGKSRHIVDTCYEKHGYPPGYKSRGRTSRAHNVFDDGAAQFLPSSQSVTPLPSDPCVNLAQEQLQQLLVLLPSSNSTSPPHVTNTASSLHQTTSTSAGNPFSFQSHHWIIDTGATGHITHSLSLFASFTAIQPVHITLPNGTKVCARFSGTVIFSDSLYIQMSFMFLTLLSVSCLSLNLLPPYLVHSLFIKLIVPYRLFPL
ncbi:hypothetical protein ES332_A03G183900v1 [Gossypium tomentosum]|uniref:Retrovirus-related Pol polyprotein from transposon TNT 1-94-like beta-barrel domain-containing protein n=1 Tax=Gossypium tomentosum TaxID=34277 RepID=A0A5D2R8J7_GOSTO|nr:hypothetical protein ES332_A03G183900v1 [Gossypium tomentosum]